MIEEEQNKQRKVTRVMETSKQVTDTQKITDEERARWARRVRWEWVEASVWTDAMLTALENGVKGNKWFSLMDKAYRPSTLESANMGY